MADTNIKISLEIADQAAQKALSNFISKSGTADQSLDNLNKKGKSTFEEIAISIGKSTGAYDIFAGNIAANIAIKGLELLTDAAKKLFDLFIVDGIKAAERQQDAINALNLSLASSGHYSVEASKDFQEFADGLQATTKFSNDAIIQNAALIESFAHLDQNGLKRATKAALDFAAASGKDLKTASEDVAKAASGNVTAFNKLGLEIQKGRTDAETFNNALLALESRFGGRAAGDVNTYSGALAQAHNQFEDLQKSIGDLIIRNPVFVNAIREVGNIFRELTATTKDAGLSLALSIGQGFIYIIEAAKVLIAGLDAFGRVFTAGFRALETYFLGWALGIAKGLNFIGLASDDTVRILKEQLVDKAKTVFTAFTEDTGLSKAGEALSRIGNSAEAGFAKLARSGLIAEKQLTNNKDAVVHLDEATKEYLKRLKEFADNLDKQSEDNKLAAEQQITIKKAQYDTDLELLKAQLDAKYINEVQYLDKKAKLDLVQQVDEQKLADDRLVADQKRLDTALRLKQTDDKKYLVEKAQLQKNYDTEQAKRDAVATKALIDNQTQVRNAEKKLNDEKISAVGDTFANISTLTQTKSKELFAIGKAASLAAAGINTYEAITKTMASVPYPFNIPLAIAQGIAGAVQVANIAATQPSFESGGIVPGNSYSGDNILANVNSGEMILNRSQQSNLFNQINSGSGSGSNNAETNGLLKQLIGAVQNKQSIHINGKEIFSVIRDGQNAGRSFS